MRLKTNTPSPLVGLVEKLAENPEPKKRSPQQEKMDFLVGGRGECPTGKKFGTLTVMGRAPNPEKRKNSRVFAKCDCGNTRSFRLQHLKAGIVTHCGCLHAKKISECQIIHGQYVGGISRKMAYTHNAMIKRCYSKGLPCYHNYGGRGITVCDRWRLGDGIKSGIELFISDMGIPLNSNLTLDRIDNNAGYSPENCRWATRREQSNNVRTNIVITCFGLKRTLAQWIRHFGWKCGNTIRDRIKRGWSAEDALTKPLKFSKQCQTS